jgi:arylsulfatase A-like enzyme
MIKGFIGLILFVNSISVLAQNAVNNKSKKPNILMICVDDLNDYIGAMGHPDAITPNMDKLIKRGTLFTNAQTQSPLCGPSRAALMTGLRPSTTGIYGLIPDNDVKGSNDATRNNIFMHQYFKNNGYYTMGRGKIFHINVPDGLMDEQERDKEIVGPFPPKKMNYFLGRTDSDWGAFPEKDEQMPDYKTAKWAVERLGKKYDQPFFLTVGFFRPHVPWHVPQKWFDMYDPAKLHLPPYLKTDFDDLPEMALKVESTFMPSTEWALENNQWRKMLQGYLACISFVDHYIGQVLNALDNSPYAKNTIVVLWSDHGFRMGEKNRFAKQCLWDRATKTPLVYAGPGIAVNKKISAPVELFSVYPTLTDLAGLQSNKNLEAKSIAPLLKNPELKWTHPTITTWGRNNHGIRIQDYHYIQYEDRSEEFYNLKEDPNEWYNKATDQKYAKIKEGLKKYIPAVNAKWAPGTKYDGVEYFKQQKLED